MPRSLAVKNNKIARKSETTPNQNLFVKNFFMSTSSSIVDYTKLILSFPLDFESTEFSELLQSYL